MAGTLIHDLSRYDIVRLDANDSTYFSKEGYFYDQPVVTRVGIFTYHNPDGSVRKEFRPPEEVFSPESLQSYEGKPVIITHDAGAINKDNVTDEAIGTILGPGEQDGDNVRAKIVIYDTDSMKDSGLRELSLGYSLDLENEPGEYNGEHYDAVQKNIRINHLALVEEARAGETARLNLDGKDTLSSSEEGGKAMSKRYDGDTLSSEEFKKRIDEFSEEAENMDADEAPENDEDQDLTPIEAEDAADDEEESEPTVAEKIQMVRDHRDRRDAEEDPEDLKSATAKIAEQDEDIQTLLDCIDAMEAEKDLAADCGKKDSADDEEIEEDEDEEPVENLNKDSVDRIVRERLKVLRIGDKLNMDGLEDLSVHEMKKKIIRKVSPNTRLDGKRKSYVDAAFDWAVDNLVPERKGVAYQRRQMMGMGMNMDGVDKSGLTSAERAREAMIARNEGGNE